MDPIDPPRRRPPPPQAQATAPGREPVRRLHSDELFDGQREVEIVHRDALYRLRHTAAGKLILTK